MTFIRFIILTTTLLAIAACSPSFQTTSGQAYLSRSTTPIDPDIKRAADIEPDLRLPARIGIARVVNGKLTPIPSHEVEILTKLAERHNKMGEFVPVSPLIAAMVDTHAHTTAQTVQQIRLTSARQHLDYVIIYEAGARSSRKATPFALADVTLIGGLLLPTRQVDVEGVGHAIFMDVRNGYPYATVGTTLDLTGFSRTFFGDRREAELQQKATAAILGKLSPQLDEMLSGLTTRAGRR